MTTKILSFLKFKYYSMHCILKPKNLVRKVYQEKDIVKIKEHIQIAKKMWYESCEKKSKKKDEYAYMTNITYTVKIRYLAPNTSKIQEITIFEYYGENSYNQQFEMRTYLNYHGIDVSTSVSEFCMD